MDYTGCWDADIPENQKKGALLLVVSGAGSSAWAGILKPVISRVRPYDMFDWISIKIIKPSDGSFPSGHTMSSFAFSMALLFVCRKWGIFALIFSCLMGFSRLYFQVHFLTDVLAGMILGILCAVIIYGIAAKTPWFEVGRKNAKLAKG